MTSLLFLQCYAEFFSVEVLNPIDTSCDNKGYVTCLKQMLENTFHSETLYKLKEQDALQTVLSLIPPYFSIRHIKAHQDDNESYNNLTLDAKLNVDADYIATEHVSIPINTHILIPPFAIYLNQKYIHQRIENQIREKKP